MPEAGSDDWLTHLELMHFAEGSAMTPILLNLYVGLLGEAGAPLHPRIQSELDSHFAHMERMLRPSGHFVLDDLSAADIMLSFPAEIAVRLGRGDDFPRLAAFVDHIRSRPAYVRATAAGGGD
ncbi:glutathione S-transferase C-terminal domain-containing protein [Jhaorihella thermophila]